MVGRLRIVSRNDMGNRKWSDPPEPKLDMVTIAIRPDHTNSFWWPVPSRRHQNGSRCLPWHSGHFWVTIFWATPSAPVCSFWGKPKTSGGDLVEYGHIWVNIWSTLVGSALGPKKFVWVRPDHEQMSSRCKNLLPIFHQILPDQTFCSPYESRSKSSFGYGTKFAVYNARNENRINESNREEAKDEVNWFLETQRNP